MLFNIVPERTKVDDACEYVTVLVAMVVLNTRFPFVVLAVAFEVVAAWNFRPFDGNPPPVKGVTLVPIPLQTNSKVVIYLSEASELRIAVLLAVAILKLIAAYFAVLNVVPTGEPTNCCTCGNWYAPYNNTPTIATAKAMRAFFVVILENCVVISQTRRLRI